MASVDLCSSESLSADLLGGISFGDADARLLAVAARQLAPVQPQVLVISADTPPRDGSQGRVRYRATEALLFGRIVVDDDPAASLEAVTEKAYRELFEALGEQGYPTLVRVWNYLPEINADDRGVERYRRFNAGRQQAFGASGRPVEGKVPAACALGTRSGPLSIAFLAAREPFTPLENPRQVSAYHYPPEYGERSPTFSRGGILALPEATLLFVSGTAAIVGHQSLHGDDVVAQTREAMANLAAVVEQANRVCAAASFDLPALGYTVYLRHASDLSAVSAVLADTLPADARVVVVEADICRAELLVEIEAWAVAPAGARE